MRSLEQTLGVCPFASGQQGMCILVYPLWRLFQAILFAHNKLSERLRSSDSGFSFTGSIQEVIKLREQWKKAML